MGPYAGGHEVKGDPNETDSNHHSSAANRQHWVGALRGACAAARNQTNRPATARSQRARTGGRLGARRLRSGYVAPKHTHPGEEIIYVLEGTLEYEIDGKLSTVKPGDVLFVPAGIIHSVKNIGTSNGAELATYVVEKGKPLITLAR